MYSQENFYNHELSARSLQVCAEERHTDIASPWASVGEKMYLYICWLKLYRHDHTQFIVSKWESLEHFTDC